MEFSVSDIKKKFFIFSQKKAFLIFQETSYISGNNFLLSDKKKNSGKMYYFSAENGTFWSQS